MVIKETPENWKDLQIEVGNILNECGFSVEVEKKINSIRGKVEIDVFAEEKIDDRTYSILCECKYWKANIPQTIIHAFRSVITDLGSNIGYIITTSDFQSGSITANINTNIKLLNWEEFQNEFFDSWYWNFFSKKIHKIVKTNYDNTAIQFFENFDLIEKSKFRSLIDQYNDLEIISSHFPHKIMTDIQEEDIKKKLPLNMYIEKNILEEWDLVGCSIPRDILTETNYTILLSKLEDYSTPIYNELDKLNLYLEYDD